MTGAIFLVFVYMPLRAKQKIGSYTVLINCRDWDPVRMLTIITSHIHMSNILHSGMQISLSFKLRKVSFKYLNEMSKQVINLVIR